MEQYTAPMAELLLFSPAQQIAFQVYNENGSFGGSTDIISTTEPTEGFEDW